MLNVQLTKLNEEQAAYIGVSVDGPSSRSTTATKRGSQSI